MSMLWFIDGLTHRSVGLSVAADTTRPASPAEPSSSGAPAAVPR
jgi:hypothetical protein